MPNRMSSVVKLRRRQFRRWIIYIFHSGHDGSIDFIGWIRKKSAPIHTGPIAIYFSGWMICKYVGDHLPTSPCFSFSVAARSRVRTAREIPSIFSLSQFSAPAGGLHKSSCSRRIRCSAARAARFGVRKRRGGGGGVGREVADRSEVEKKMSRAIPPQFSRNVMNIPRDLTGR